MIRNHYDTPKGLRYQQHGHDDDDDDDPSSSSSSSPAPPAGPASLPHGVGNTIIGREVQIRVVSEGLGTGRQHVPRRGEALDADPHTVLPLWDERGGHGHDDDDDDDDDGGGDDDDDDGDDDGGDDDDDDDDDDDASPGGRGSSRP
jgi:hypothetical protein